MMVSKVAGQEEKESKEGKEKPKEKEKKCRAKEINRER
jgi:hypothetical protein